MGWRWGDGEVAWRVKNNVQDHLCRNFRHTRTQRVPHPHRRPCCPKQALTTDELGVNAENRVRPTHMSKMASPVALFDGSCDGMTAVPVAKTDASCSSLMGRSWESDVRVAGSNAASATRGARAATTASSSTGRIMVFAGQRPVFGFRWCNVGTAQALGGNTTIGFYITLQRGHHVKRTRSPGEGMRCQNICESAARHPFPRLAPRSRTIAPLNFSRLVEGRTYL